MATLTDQAFLAGYMDHASRRVLIIFIVGFVLIGLVAPWVRL